MLYTKPNDTGSKASYKSRYENFIGGKWVPPVDGKYFENVSPVNGKVFCEVARSNEKDVELALDAAHSAFESWGKTSATERSNLLLKIADKMEENLEMLAVAETWDNGKPVRETLAADLPLCVDHFRYFAACIRADESGVSEIDANTISMHVHEPLGVIAQIIPWNFPLLMACWKVAPALAAGNTVILKPAEQTPASIMMLAELLSDLIPEGVLNVVNGYGEEAGKPLASSSRVAKVAFTGETTTGQLIMSYASANLIPVSLELGGKSPNIFYEDVLKGDDAFRDKALEGITMFALNQGEVCTCPSRALVQASIYDEFLSLSIDRASKIKQGNPLHTDTMIGAQVSPDQMDKILGYISIGQSEGASIRLGGKRADLGGELTDGYYVEPTVFEGQNEMRIFQEEIFGPVLSVTAFKSESEALKIANDTAYGLGAGVWTRDFHKALRTAKGLQAGRVWTNCYHLYPAHAAFGGYKKSGIGRETHKMMLSQYQQTKNILLSSDENPMGFF